ncbi:hypothetical protein DPEC_G00135150, partial [Dallia pectoralis]
DNSKLLSALREDPEGLILFLKNIRKIQFHEINRESVKLKTIFSTEKSFNEDSSAKRDSFQTFVRQSLVSKNPATPHEAIYNVNISSTGSRKSQWIIAEQFGSFKENTIEEVQTGKVPQAAVAARVYSQTECDKFTGKVFCSLPLPGKTGLPIHVNGNFEVDSSRRTLWKADGESLKANWNTSLKQNIVSPLYASLLSYICNQKKLKATSIHLLDLCLERSYLLLFPTITNDIDSDWQEMIYEVYRSVSERGLCVVPVLHSSMHQVPLNYKTILNKTNIKEYTIIWSNVSQKEPTHAPFLSVENNALTSILDDIGMQLVPPTPKMQKIWTSFKKAGVKVKNVCPSTVGNYLRIKPLNDPTQTENDLPLPINKTLIR